MRRASTADKAPALLLEAGEDLVPKGDGIHDLQQTVAHGSNLPLLITPDYSQVLEEVLEGNIGRFLRLRTSSGLPQQSSQQLRVPAMA
jgi:hypothetical protein